MHEFYEQIYEKKSEDQKLITDSSKSFENPITGNTIDVFYEGIKGMWYFAIDMSDDEDLGGYITGLVSKHQTASRSYWSAQLILEDRMNNELTRVRGNGNAVPDGLKNEIGDQSRIDAIIGALYFLNEQPEIDQVVDTQ